MTVSFPITAVTMQSLLLPWKKESGATYDQLRTVINIHQNWYQDHRLDRLTGLVVKASASRAEESRV